MLNAYWDISSAKKLRFEISMQLNFIGRVIRKLERWSSNSSASTVNPSFTQSEVVPEDLLAKQLLAGKTALVTGGASNIGRGIAIEMAQQGANIIVVDKDQAACERLKPTISGMGVQYHAFTIDITDTAAIAQMLQALRDQNQAINILVNNVGIVPHETGFGNLAGNHFRDLFEVNVFAPMALTYQVTQAMLATNKPGVILFITSIHQSVTSRWIAYSSSKAAIQMAVQELALELAGANIRVNGIAPGWVAEDEQANPKPHPYTPLGKCSINPRYIGRAAVYLASDYFSRFTTGTVLTIDAGLSLYNSRTQEAPPPHFH